MISVIEWSCDPIAIKIFSVSIHWYGICFALAFLSASLIMKKLFIKNSSDSPAYDKLFTYMFLGTLIGARLGHCLFYNFEYFSSNPLKIFYVWEGGLASHGGTIGISLALYFFIKKYSKYKYLYVADMLAVSCMIGAFFIRIGNFFNSEIIGVESDLPWAVIFLNTSSPIPKHPTQLYESLCYLGIFLLSYFLYTKKSFNKNYGFITGLVLILCFSARFLLEFTKERQASFMQDSLISMGQILSIIPILFGIYLIKNALNVKKSVNK